MCAPCSFAAMASLFSCSVEQFGVLVMMSIAVIGKNLRLRLCYSKNWELDLRVT